MAAFCQQHRCGLLFAVPVTPDIAVALVHIAHCLYMNYRHHLAYGSLQQDLLDLLEEGTVAQHMAHKYRNTFSLCRQSKVRAFLGSLCYRFFQEQIIAKFNSLHSWRVMHLIQGSNNSNICHLGLAQNLLPAGEAGLLRKSAKLPYLFPAGTDRVCHAYDLIRIRHLCHESCISAASVARANDNCSDLFPDFFLSRLFPVDFSVFHYIF